MKMPFILTCIMVVLNFLILQKVTLAFTLLAVFIVSFVFGEKIYLHVCRACHVGIDYSAFKQWQHKGMLYHFMALCAIAWMVNGTF